MLQNSAIVKVPKWELHNFPNVPWILIFLNINIILKIWMKFKKNEHDGKVSKEKITEHFCLRNKTSAKSL